MKSIDIVIGDGFPLISLSLVTEPLRVANRESPRPVFERRILSVDGKPPQASGGMTFNVDGALDDRPADAVILLASYFPDRMISRDLLAWLRRHARQRTLMGCVDTGAHIFAKAGLLTRRPAAMHQEAIFAYREKSGRAFFLDRLFDFEGDRFSSVGGVATFDMTLALISHFENRKLARRVARVLYYDPLESRHPDGAMAISDPLQRTNKDLAQALEIMTENIETPVKIRDICERIDTPGWQLRRLFLRHLGQTPQLYYLHLRLNRARNLLRNSAEKISTIALMCGFPASESLSRAYRTRYGVAPSTDRAHQAGAQ